MSGRHTEQGHGTFPRIWILLTLASTLFVQLPQGHCEATRAEPVSIVSLIAEPEAYNGKRVVVTGYASLGWERSRLFLTPYDAQEYDNNSLFLDLGNTALEPDRELTESEKAKRKQWDALLDHETVELEGTFYYPGKKKGIFWSGYPNGIITNITDMKLRDLHPQRPSATPEPK